MRLTNNWTLEELTFSDYAVRHGIDNTPPTWAINNLNALAVHSLQSLSDLAGHPIISHSGYRCPQLNQIIGGVTAYFSDGTVDWGKTSQHVKGEAADIVCPAMSLDDLFNLAAKNVPFDQLIFEGTWIHISYSQPCRGQMMTATFIDGVAHYTPRFV